MVENNRCLRKGAGEVDQLAELGVVHPGVKAQAKRSEPGKAFAHPRVHQQTRGPDDRRAPGRLLGMRGGDKADAAETAAAGPDHRLKHLFDRGAEGQIGVSDDAGADPRPVIGSGGSHCRNTVGEFDLADRTQLDRTCGAVHRQPFEVDGRGDVVPASRASGACAAGVR